MVRNDDFKLRTDTWQEMIVALSDKGYEVDSAYQRSPEKHILAYKDGNTYSIEVTQYFKGDYEVLSDNIHIDDYDDVESATDDTEYDPEGYTEWTEIRSKSVRDSDGFMTDYTLWYNEFTGMYVCIFGDKDIYYPENADPDMEFESEDEAIEWFDNYDEDTLFESTQVDECKDIKAGTDKVTLTIQYYPYERHISTPLTRARVSGPNLLEALKNLVDKVGMYLDREQIEDEEMSPEDIIQYLMMVNGDGCDYITELKNASTGEILIEAEDFDEEEDWDD